MAKFLQIQSVFDQCRICFGLVLEFSSNNNKNESKTDSARYKPDQDRYKKKTYNEVALVIFKYFFSRAYSQATTLTQRFS